MAFPDHCPVHDPSNVYCPSCIVAKRDFDKAASTSAKAEPKATEPAPVEEPVTASK